jgi:hypothetical protein
MENVVLFKLQDDTSLYVADLAAGTIERRDPELAEDGDPIAALMAATNAQSGEAPFIKGIDFALAATSRSSAAAHTFYK